MTIIGRTEVMKNMAESLPWELQSALLAIQDDGEVRMNTIPGDIQECLLFADLIKNKGGIAVLSDLGAKLVIYCSC